MRRVFSVLLAVGVLWAVIYYGLISTKALPDHRIIHGINDLVFHALAFAALFFSLSLLYPLGICILATSVGAILVEGFQIFLPDRTASIPDILASFLGIVVAGLIVWIFRRLVAARRHVPDA